MYGQHIVLYDNISPLYFLGFLFDLILSNLILWHINLGRLSNVKFIFYTYKQFCFK